MVNERDTEPVSAAQFIELARQQYFIVQDSLPNPPQALDERVLEQTLHKGSRTCLLSGIRQLCQPYELGIWGVGLKRNSQGLFSVPNLVTGRSNTTWELEGEFPQVGDISNDSSRSVRSHPINVAKSDLSFYRTLIKGRLISPETYKIIFGSRKYSDKKYKDRGRVVDKEYDISELNVGFRGKCINEVTYSDAYPREKSWDDYAYSRCIGEVLRKTIGLNNGSIHRKFPFFSLELDLNAPSLEVGGVYYIPRRKFVAKNFFQENYRFPPKYYRMVTFNYHGDLEEPKFIAEWNDKGNWEEVLNRDHYTAFGELSELNYLKLLKDILDLMPKDPVYNRER